MVGDFLKFGWLTTWQRGRLDWYITALTENMTILQRNTIIQNWQMHWSLFLVRNWPKKILSRLQTLVRRGRVHKKARWATVGLLYTTQTLTKPPKNSPGCSPGWPTSAILVDISLLDMLLTLCRKCHNKCEGHRSVQRNEQLSAPAVQKLPVVVLDGPRLLNIDAHPLTFPRGSSHQKSESANGQWRGVI